MPGNIFHFAYSQYLKDTKKVDKLENSTDSSLDLSSDKLNKIWVSRYEVIETPPTVVSKILTFLNNETFMDIIN